MLVTLLCKLHKYSVTTTPMLTLFLLEEINEFNTNIEQFPGIVYINNTLYFLQISLHYYAVLPKVSITLLIYEITPAFYPFYFCRNIFSKASQIKVRSFYENNNER